MINCKHLQETLITGTNETISRCGLGKELDCDNCDGREHSVMKELAASAKAIVNEPKLASAELITLRKEKCESCKHRNGRRCRICKCFIDVKIRFQATQCPMKVW